MCGNGELLCDYISYFYLIFYLLKTAISFIVSVLCIIAIIKNVRQKYVDMLKVIQSIILFVYFICRFLFNPFVKSLESKYWQDIHEGLNQLTDTCFMYYFLNQFSWYILSEHLTTYK